MYLKASITNWTTPFFYYKVTDWGLRSVFRLPDGTGNDWSWDLLIGEMSKLTAYKSIWGDCDILTDDEYFLELI